MTTIRFPRPLLGVALAALLLLSATAGAQDLPPEPWRALYSGQFGNETVFLDLAIYQDGYAYARLSRPAHGEVLPGWGRSGDDGALQLSFYAQRQSTSPSFSTDYAHQEHLLSDTTTADGPLAATLSGRRAIDWQAEGATLEASLLLVGEAARSATLTRFAQYATWSFQQGRISSAFSLPRFLGEEQRSLNRMLEDEGRARMQSFLEEGREEVESGALGWGWYSGESIDLVGSAGAFRSFLFSTANYTGGAHPNSYYSSYLLEQAGDGQRLYTLGELFTPGSDWLDRVGQLVLEELERQEAEWVLQGGVEMTADELATFTLSPIGLTFYFDPYAMGPYVQGNFVVSIPLTMLDDLFPPGSPLDAFMRQHD